MGRINKQIEREEVLKPCLKLCKVLHLQGAILQYRRLDVFDKTHIEGSPDIEIFFPKDNFVWILMAECKKPIGGILSASQKDYQFKYKNFGNIIYSVITAPYLIKDIIYKYSDFNNKNFKEFEEFNL